MEYAKENDVVSNKWHLATGDKEHIYSLAKNHYFADEDLSKKGIPTVTQCGEDMNMSGSYLSDLLRLETGRSAKDHIHSYIIEKAKTLLLNSNASISEVSFELGFEYSQHFSKLFKSKTGFNPTDYRSLN